MKFQLQKFWGPSSPYSDRKINTEIQQIKQLTWKFREKFVIHSK